RVVRPQRGIGEESPQPVVVVARRPADTDLHRAGRPAAVGDSGPARPGLRRAGRIGVAAVVTFLLADPGKDLPRDLVLRPDLLVDRQKARRDVANRLPRRRITNSAPGAALTEHDREQG